MVTLSEKYIDGCSSAASRFAGWKGSAFPGDSGSLLLIESLRPAALAVGLSDPCEEEKRAVPGKPEAYRPAKREAAEPPIS
jgi:hypothetical protein